MRALKASTKVTVSTLVKLSPSNSPSVIAISRRRDAFLAKVASKARSKSRFSANKSETGYTHGKRRSPLCGDELWLNSSDLTQPKHTTKQPARRKIISCLKETCSDRTKCAFNQLFLQVDVTLLTGNQISQHSLHAAMAACKFDHAFSERRAKEVAVETPAHLRSASQLGAEIFAPDLSHKTVPPHSRSIQQTIPQSARHSRSPHP